MTVKAGSISISRTSVAVSVTVCGNRCFGRLKLPVRMVPILTFVQVSIPDMTSITDVTFAYGGSSVDVRREARIGPLTVS